MIKPLCVAMGVLFACPAYAQDVDCSVIKNNPASKERCLAGQRDAAKYANEAKKYERRAKIRDAVCVADSVAAVAAARAAGFSGTIVYRGTRAAADALSNGASSCVKRAY